MGMRIISIVGVMLCVMYNSLAQTNSDKTELNTLGGTFVTLEYQDLRNKYMNPSHIKQTEEFWELKLQEFNEIGLEYIVIQFSANEGRAFYPSKSMPLAYLEEHGSPISAILKGANEHNMKVIIASGWGYNQFDDTKDEEIRESMITIMEEISELYGEEPSFYGWYIPAEADLSQVLESKTMVQDINTLTKKAKNITPDKKVMISPYGIWNGEINEKQFAEKIKKLKVDIIAYQDEVGCVRESAPIPKMKENFKQIGEITNQAGIEFWSNVESFTWADEPNSTNSALIPAPFPRYLSQIVGANQAGAKEIISFSVFGVMDKPDSPIPLGEPETAAKFYKNYMDWKEGKGRWALLERTFKEDVSNKARGASLNFYTSPSTKHDSGNLTDNVFAYEDYNDSNWLGFENGSLIFEMDLDSLVDINSIALRFLQSTKHDIFLPEEIDFYLSENGITYKKIGTTKREVSKRNHLDDWIDLEMLDGLKEKGRYLKIDAKSEDDSMIFIDAVIVN